VVAWVDNPGEKAYATQYADETDGDGATGPRD
jgi:hypothetical protein